MHSHVLLFGDQTTSSTAAIKELYQHAPHSCSLKSFLQDSSTLLRPFAADLSLEGNTIGFATISDLAEAYAATKENNTVISTVLLCVAQLGSLILHAERKPEIIQKDFCDQYIAGFCTGLLPAVTFSAATSLPQLLALAPEILGVALRLGIQAHRRSTQIEVGSDIWSTAVSGVTLEQAQKVLKAFNKNLPLHKHLYVSNISDKSLTISGPPTLMNSLFESDLLATSATKKVSIHSVYHASHLQIPDINAIIGNSLALDVALRPASKVLSTRSGIAYSTPTLRSTLVRVIEDILALPMRTDMVIDSLVAHTSGRKVSLISVGPEKMVKSISQTLSSKGVEVIVVDEVVTEEARGDANAIAIVGMAGRFPEADSLQEFWDLLKEGRDVHREVPNDRFDVSTHVDPTGKLKNATLSAYGCFINQPGMFDTRLFNMSPREAAQTDPVHRLLLIATYEALEMAGYASDGSSEERNIGTFIGMTADDYREYNSSQNIDVYYVTGGLRAFAPGRLNYHFKWDGPSFSLDTACSSSAAAMDLACQSLLLGKCSAAVAGGSGMMTGPNLYSGLSRGGFLSPTGGSKTFDDTADGYCRGDAVGVVVLKKLSDAIANGDNIQGVIRGVVTNHSAHALSITLPHSPAQQALYSKILKDAALEPCDISYIEMHGTGTQAGDTIEMSSVTSTFGKDRASDNPLYLGNVKSNVGHGEGAAGITSLIKTLLMFREDTIPPHAGLKTKLNTKFPPLADLNLHIARKAEKFHSCTSDGKRRALINNFNATGGNTCVIVEEPPQQLSREGIDPRMHHVVTLSAKTAWSFKENKSRFIEYLKENPETRIQDLAYTTTSRKMHHNIRAAYSVHDVADLQAAVHKDLAGDGKPTLGGDKTPVVFCFSGQGAQYAGMGKELFETSTTFRDTILEYDALCTKMGFPSFVDVIRDSTTDLSAAGPVKSQLSMLSLELALFQLWTSWGIKPDLVLGHSLGEYAALCAAGVLSLADMFFLAGKRAELMQARCKQNSYAMLAVRSDVDGIQKLLGSKLADGLCEIVCINSDTGTVLGGTVEALEPIKTAVTEVGFAMSQISVPYAFHSNQMDSILAELEDVANMVEFHAPRVPIASSVLGKIVTASSTFSPSYMVQQTRRPVNFLGAVQAIRASHPGSLWIENGPDSTCAPMISLTLSGSPAVVTSTLRGSKQTPWKSISNAMAQLYACGVPIKWQPYHQEYKKSLRLVNLPTYAFELKNYWLQYEGDWAITKNHHVCPKTVEAAPIEAPREVKISTFSTTCLQQVDSESFSDESCKVEFSSDLSSPILKKLIEGHLVNGIGLCPSAVYTEMALAAGDYIYSRLYPGEKVPCMDVLDFEISRPLVLRQGNEEHRVKILAAKSASSCGIKLSVSSCLNGVSQDHARCVIEFGDGLTWQRTWSRNSYLISERIATLAAQANAGDLDRLRGKMVYKVFGEIVGYPQAYKGIQEIVMNAGQNEAYARIKFRQTPPESSFLVDPCWIDVVAQVPGFVLNGSIVTPPDVVYLSTGWESLRMAKPLSSEKQYTAYTRMQPSGTPGLLLGDCTILEDDVVVAVAIDLKFHEVKKNILHRILPGSRDLSGQFAPPAPQAQAPQAQPKPLRTTQTARTAAISSATAQKSKQSSPEAVKVRAVSDAIAGTSFAAVLRLIAAEVGVGLDELTNDSIFEELGVDSLLTISIATKLKDDLELDFPGTIFALCENVGQLRDYFERTFPQSTMAPQTSSDDSELDDWEHLDSPEDPGLSSASSTSLDQASEVNLADIFLLAISKETGIPIEEIDPNTDFGDLGIDSLMSIAVLSAVTEETHEQLPASLFAEHQTLNSLRKVLGERSPPPLSPAAPPKSRKATPVVPIKTVAAPTISSKPAFDASKHSSNVVFLQGDARSRHPPLFLVTEGTGSAACYLHFPQFDSKVPVYAIESPFLHKPIEFTCTIEEICSIFVRAIRKTRPHGPYFIGGWSIGGIYAYETSLQLINLGERVNGMILIDSPCPHKMEGLPDLTVEVLEETGMFVKIPARGVGPDTPMPLGQKQHVTGCVRAASAYAPVPMTEAQTPLLTIVIWSEHGLFEQLSDKVKEATAQSERPEEEKVGISKDWLSGKRTTFGPQGWDRLLGNIECYSMEGDHFSIMNAPRIKKTGKLVSQALDAFLGLTPPPPSLHGKHAIRLGGARPSQAAQIVENQRAETCTFVKAAGFSDFFSTVYPLQRKLVLAYLVEAFAALGCNLAALSPGEQLPNSTYLDVHQRLMPQLYRILEDGSLITTKGGAHTRTSTEVDGVPSQQLYSQIQEQCPQHVFEHKLLNVTASRFGDCLSGAADPLQLLFQDNQDLLTDMYLHAPMLDAANQQLCQIVLGVAQSMPQGSKIRILEVGGGLGATTVTLVNLLGDNGVPFSYTFSDISGYLVSAARKRFAKVQGMEFAALNIEKEPPAKLAGQFDFVFSTNCIHATSNLAVSTENIRKMLKPEGFMSLVELTQNLFWFDLVFGLLEGWWLFSDGREHVLAGEEFWTESLHKAGYGKVVFTDGDSKEARVVQIITAFQPGL